MLDNNKLIILKKKQKKFICYNYNNTRFLFSAPNIYHLPYDIGYEIAFIGRSNSGKSSVLNTLTNKKNLSRTSKTPGCTKLINVFEVKNNVRLIDLPGYGYTKFFKKKKIDWLHMLIKYFNCRNSLKGLVILMDIRNPMSILDQKILEQTKNLNISILLLLNKIDKISINICKKQVFLVKKKISKLFNTIRIETFSVKSKQGTDKLKNILDNWLNQNI